MKAFFSIVLAIHLTMFYSDAQLECPFPDKENATLLPHPTNCNNYFVCEIGEPTPMRCPKGLHFNPRLLVCDWPWQANCTAEKSYELLQ